LMRSSSSDERGRR